MIVGNVHLVELYFVIDILKQHHNRFLRSPHHDHLLLLLLEHIHIDNIVPLMHVCDQHGELDVEKSKPNNTTYNPIIHEGYIYMEIMNAI